MIKEEALQNLIDIRDEATAYPNAVCYVTSEDEDSLNIAIEALKAKTEGDLISKQAALAEFMDGRDVFDIMESIEKLPSAEAVQGEWTNEDGKPITDKFSVYCSRCKRWSEYRTNYCGHCGMKMGGNTDD